MDPKAAIQDLAAALTRLDAYEVANRAISSALRDDTIGWETPEELADAVELFVGSAENRGAQGFAKETGDHLRTIAELKAQLDFSKKDYAAAREKIESLASASFCKDLAKVVVRDAQVASQKEALDWHRAQIADIKEALMPFAGATLTEKIEIAKGQLDVAKFDIVTLRALSDERGTKLQSIKDHLHLQPYENELDKIASMKEERDGLLKQIISLEKQLDAQDDSLTENGKLRERIGQLEQNNSDAMVTIKKKDEVSACYFEIIKRYEEASGAIAMAHGFKSTAWPTALDLKERACGAIASLKHQVDDLGKRLQQAQDLERNGHTSLCQERDKWRMEAQRLGDIVKRFEMVLAGRKVDGES